MSDPAGSAQEFPFLFAIRDAAFAAAAAARETQVPPPPPHQAQHDAARTTTAGLSEEERALLLRQLAGFAVSQAAAQRWRTPWIELIYEAVMATAPPAAPETITDIFTYLATRNHGRVGLARTIAVMERGDHRAYAVHRPLLDAYHALLNHHLSLATSSHSGAENEARIETVLGLRPDRDRAPPARGDQDKMAFTAIVALVEEHRQLHTALVEWWHAARATDAGFPDSLAREYIRRVHGEAPGEPSNSAEIYRRLLRVPLSALAKVSPPPPDWVLQAEALQATVMHRTGMRFLQPTLQVIERSAMAFAPCFDEERITAMNHAALDMFDPARPVWSHHQLQAAWLLQPDGDTALTDLLGSARGAAPTNAWLSKAARLTDGAGRMNGVRAWVDLLAAPWGDAPSPAIQQKAHQYRAIADRLPRFVAATGSARSAAILALCGASDVRASLAGLDRDGDPPWLLSEANALAATGAAWLLSRDPAEVPRLARLAAAMHERVPSVRSGTGYRSLKALNACIWALGQIGDAASVGAIGQLRRRVRDERLSKVVAAAMAQAARQAGMTIEDLEELSAPTHGLEGRGDPAIHLALAGDTTAELAIIRSSLAAVTLRNAAGKIAKSTPAVVKADAEALAALKQLQTTAREIGATLPALCAQIERSWITGRIWTGRVFRERLLEHPLLSWVAARLIWTVTPACGGATFTCLLPGADPAATIGRDGSYAAGIGEEDRIALWHPLDAADGQEVQDWRALLEQRGIVQPIRQAHREAYPLTDAERATATYSNRFAGHLLRQAQANALARLRGWSCRTRISADVPNDAPTHLRIPAFGLAAELWTEGVGEEWTDAHAYLFIRTDRVVFRRLHDAGDWRRDGGASLGVGAETVALADVPPRILSEVLRDADLFVSVASIALDPDWVDGGREARHPNQWRRGPATAYWRTFNQAELTGNALARRDVLAALLPRLAIGAACRLDDRFLHVAGRLNRYRLHVGSGNVFMAPHDRYICIVADRRTADAASNAIRLPFEGDAMLSLIISKAVMLARDDLIVEPGIVSQIRAASSE